MTGSVGIVRGYGERVILRTQLAIEAERDAHGLARGSRSQRHRFQFGIGAIHVQSNTVADQHSYYGIDHFALELHRDAHVHSLTTAPYHGWLPIGAECLDLQDLGAPVAAAEMGGQRRRGSIA